LDVAPANAPDEPVAEFARLMPTEPPVPLADRPADTATVPPLALSLLPAVRDMEPASPSAADPVDISTLPVAVSSEAPDAMEIPPPTPEVPPLLVARVRAPLLDVEPRPD
jgi:hypothetical protein